MTTKPSISLLRRLLIATLRTSSSLNSGHLAENKNVPPRWIVSPTDPNSSL